MDYSTNIPKPVNGGEGTSSQPISPSSPSSSSLAVPRQAVRTEMVNAARQFLANPRVRLTPVHEQRDFLKGKGLTEEEIEAAMADIAEKRLVNGQRQQSNVHALDVGSLPAHGQVPLQPRANHLLDMAKSFLVFGSASYIFYRFVRSWLLPQLMGIPDPAEEKMQRMEAQITELRESNRAIADSLAQALGTVTEQNEQISRTLLLLQGQSHQQLQRGGTVDQQELMAEIGIVKSLLLGQNQFPPIPSSALASPFSSRNQQNPTMNGNGVQITAKAKIPGVPAWQLAGIAENEKMEEAELSGSGDGSEV